MRRGFMGLLRKAAQIPTPAHVFVSNLPTILPSEIPFSSFIKTTKQSIPTKMVLFRSLSVPSLSLSAYKPPPDLPYAIPEPPTGRYFYYYPYYRSYYPNYRFNSCRTYVSFYNRHYSNWPEHHFSSPYKNYQPLSFYGSYTYAPYRPYKNSSGYYYGWSNGPLGGY